MDDFLDLQIDDIDLNEWESDKDTRPMGSSMPTMEERRELKPGTQCYFCDYRAVKRTPQGHPTCDQCYPPK